MAGLKNDVKMSQVDVRASTSYPDDICLIFTEKGEEADVIYEVSISRENAKWIRSALKHAIRLNEEC